MAQQCPKCGYEGVASAVDDLKNGATGAAAGAAIGSMVPVVGTQQLVLVLEVFLAYLLVRQSMNAKSVITNGKAKILPII